MTLSGEPRSHRFSRQGYNRAIVSSRVSACQNYKRAINEHPQKQLGLFIKRRVTDGAISIVEWCRTVEQVYGEVRVYALSFDAVVPSKWRNELPNDAALCDPDWWRESGLTVALVYTVDGLSPEQLEAAREAGVSVVIEMDSDGDLFRGKKPSASQFLAVAGDRGLIQALREQKAALDLWLDREGRQLTLRALAAANAIKIESEAPAARLKRCFRGLKREDLAERVVIVPFMTRAVWHGSEVGQERLPRVVVAGRLNASQKRPEMVACVVKRLLADEKEVQVSIHVRGEGGWLESQLSDLPRVDISTNTSREDLAAVLRRSQVLLSTSRWESTPIQGLEAGCCGCSIVAPRELPGYQSMIGHDFNGATYASWSPRAAVRAIQRELAAWRAGERDPDAIQQKFRAETSGPAVVKRLLATVGAQDIGGAVSCS